jgi:hypothetical protein
MLPTPAKLYVESVLQGKREPITEADFSQDELAALKELIAAAPGGGVTYDTYGKVSASPANAAGMPGLLAAKGRVANSLGQFDYASDPEGTTVTDSYAFSPVYKNLPAIANVAAALGTVGYSPLHLLGEHMLPQGKGRPVRIRLQSRFPNE